jgi:hypothetical protein
MEGDRLRHQLAQDDVQRRDRGEGNGDGDGMGADLRPDARQPTQGRLQQMRQGRLADPAEG